MRLRFLACYVLLVTICALVACSARAAAPAEPTKSTIRIVTSTAPVAAAAPDAPQEVMEPRELAAPAGPVEQAAQHRSSQPDIVSSQPVVAPPQPSAEQYPVRQAIHTAPIAASMPMRTPTAGRTPPIVNVYASANAQAALTKMPPPMSVLPRPKAPQSPQRGKPFQSVQSEPTISPYMNMYRRDADANNLPNYFAFVRPQLQQQEASRQQTAELQKLRGQLQGLSSPGGGSPNSANMTAHAHYMDTAQFYRGINR